MLAKLKGAVQGWMAEKDNLSGYRESLGRMLIDMHLAPHELAALDGQRRSMSIDPGKAKQIHVECFRQMSQNVMMDGFVSAEEIEALDRVATALNVRWEDLPPQHIQTYRVAHSCMEIQLGRLPALSPGAYRLNASAGEIVHAEVMGQILDERVVARQYSGGSQGMSFRVAKGVSYRFGGTRGRSIPVTAIVPVDQGVLSITNKRIAFIGQRKSFSVEWAKVLSGEPMSDGVHLAFSSRSKSATVQYLDTTYAEVLSALLVHYLG